MYRILLHPDHLLTFALFIANSARGGCLIGTMVVVVIEFDSLVVYRGPIGAFCDA